MSVIANIMGLLNKIDADTTTLLTRFLIRANQSGNANDYIKVHLKRLLDEEDAPAARPGAMRR